MQINYKQIETHSNEISRLGTTINDVIHGIVRSHECFESEVKMIINLYDEILVSKKALLKKYIHSTSQLYRLIRSMSHAIQPVSGRYEA